jgi:hypothetical protein
MAVNVASASTDIDERRSDELLRMRLRLLRRRRMLLT